MEGSFPSAFLDSSFLFAPLWSAESFLCSLSHLSEKWQSKQSSNEEPVRMHKLQGMLRSTQFCLLEVWEVEVLSELEGVTSLSEQIRPLWFLRKFGHEDFMRSYMSLKGSFEFKVLSWVFSCHGQRLFLCRTGWEHIYSASQATLWA